MTTYSTCSAVLRAVRSALSNRAGASFAWSVLDMRYPPLRPVPACTVRPLKTDWLLRRPRPPCKRLWRPARCQAPSLSKRCAKRGLKRPPSYKRPSRQPQLRARPKLPANTLPGPLVAGQASPLVTSRRGYSLGRRRKRSMK